MASPWMEELEEDECLTLLASQTVGRFAVVFGRDAPLVVPVNYVVDGRSVVFRSGYGSKLRGAAAHPASLEVDAFDLVARTGWSVLARGRTHEVFEREVGHLGLDTWVPEDKDHWMRLDIATISGRRILRDPVSPA